MKRSILALLAVAVLLGAMVPAASAKALPAAVEDQAVLQADHALLQALAKADKPAVDKLLDPDFTWTDSAGKTQTRADVLQALPQPGLGDESGIVPQERTYGDVGAVTAERGKVHALRLWVKRPAGWRALVYHEVTQLAEPSKSAGTGVNECENPCKTVPYAPQNDAERAIISSWQALETGVTAHDSAAWAPHIAEEFVQVSSSSDHPINKAGRIATLDKQKQLGVGSAPAPLVSARMFDFGEAVVMTCLHQPHSGKPVHVTRLWVKQNGQWVISISYQTAIQAAPAKTP
ncbi:MAG: nuclear transport factor 2 family protein [Acidobacteriia bacterium]|nr:nuclear transport factor 2 family protein [Terriglobia bacterium]